MEPADLNTTRVAYDTVAADYAVLLRDELSHKPIDRALLGVFAELVRAGGADTVADVGCGPGRVAAYLSSLGLKPFGIDLSPAMIVEARRAYPDLPFHEGTMTALELEDSELGGLVAWYSIIHTPPERLPAVFAEFDRVLAPGGYLLLAFQVGDERVHLEHAYGHDVSFDVYRLSPDAIVELLRNAGLAVFSRTIREPEPPETLPQAYLLARKS